MYKRLQNEKVVDEAFYKCPIPGDLCRCATNERDRKTQGPNQREATNIGAKVCATENGPFASRQRGLNVFQSLDLHQARQRPPLPRQAHYIYCFTRAQSKEVPSHLNALCGA